MQRRYRLRKNAEFQRTRRQGRAYPHPLLVLYARRGSAESVRVGITTGKRIGKAVTRNRLKRRIREVLRPLLPSLPGWDLVFVVREAAVAATFPEIVDATERVLLRSGAVKAPLPTRASPTAEAAIPARDGAAEV